MIIVIGNEKGGVGKSTLAINYASRVAQEGASTIVVDTDSQASSCNWYALRADSGQTATFPVVGNASNPAPAIVDLATRYDAVVVDVGARDYARMGELARIADLWIMPTRIGQPDLQSTASLASTLRTGDAKHKHGHVPLVIVLNQLPNIWNSVEEADAREALAAALPGVPLAATGLRDRKVWRDAGRSGKTIHEMPKREAEKAIAELDAVFAETLAFQTKAPRAKERK